MYFTLCGMNGPFHFKKKFIWKKSKVSWQRLQIYMQICTVSTFYSMFLALQRLYLTFRQLWPAFKLGHGLVPVCPHMKESYKYVQSLQSDQITHILQN